MAEDLTEVKNIVVDKIQVLNFTVATWPKEKAGIGVNYAIGYNDAEGNFIPVESKAIGFQGETFAAIVYAKVDGSLSLYENIKVALYNEIAKANNIKV